MQTPDPAAALTFEQRSGRPTRVDNGAIEPRVTLKGAVIREIVAANPNGRLKAVEYGSFGDIRRVEWHDDPKKEADDGEA